jgi:O-antigen/teichoic acid export membrane protein
MVRFFFPEHYASAAASLSVLGVGSAFLVFRGAFTSILQATHRTKGPSIIMSLAVAAQVASLFWLVPTMGIRGAALSSALASGLACVLLLLYVRSAQPGLAPLRLKWQALALLLVSVLMLPLTFLVCRGGPGCGGIYMYRRCCYSILRLAFSSTCSMRGACLPRS